MNTHKVSQEQVAAIAGAFDSATISAIAEAVKAHASTMATMAKRHPDDGVIAEARRIAAVVDTFNRAADAAVMKESGIR